MGVSIDTGGKGGKKSLDAELNLVPFIDLLVCCICFLLITAVWVQMARIEINQKGRGSIAKKSQDQPPEIQVKITILVGAEGYIISAGSSRVVIPKDQDKYDIETLTTRLEEIRKKLPNKKDLTVAVEDGIRYEHIVKTMDAALAQKFSAIKLADASAPM